MWKLRRANSIRQKISFKFQVSNTVFFRDLNTIKLRFDTLPKSLGLS